MNTQSRTNLIYIALAVVIALGLGFYFFNGPDNRSAGDRLTDAADALPHGVDDATNQLGDRTPAQKLGDAAKDLKNPD